MLASLAKLAGGSGLVTKSCTTLATPWTMACQALLSTGFPRQEYRSRLPFPSPGDLPDPGMEPRSPAMQADSSPSEPPGKPTYFRLLKSSPSLVRVSGRAFNTSLLSPLPLSHLLSHPAPPQFFQHDSQNNFLQNKYDTLLLKTFWDF